ncbi:MAG: response regulator [Rhodanobacteraceae bacterium]|nr:MAG: response regulator [Rhodanobacteraceae bacterium]
MVRILIAEDEAKTRRYLMQGLHEQDFTVDAVADGNAALALLRERIFDAAILDVMLPGRDGWTIVKALRSDGIRTPVLFLTARDHVEDRVRGFELGADDYLVKPFAFAELVARLRNLTRRSEPAGTPGVLRVGDLTIDLLRHHVERAGRTVQLTPKEYAMLLLLARQRGRVLARTLIVESVWGVGFETEANVVDVVIRRLRAKLDTPFAAPLLHTVRGVGYLLDADGE